MHPEEDFLGPKEIAMSRLLNEVGAGILKLYEGRGETKGWIKEIEEREERDIKNQKKVCGCGWVV